MAWSASESGCEGGICWKKTHGGERCSGERTQTVTCGDAGAQRRRGQMVESEKALRRSYETVSLIASQVYLYRAQSLYPDDPSFLGQCWADESGQLIVHWEG